MPSIDRPEKADERRRSHSNFFEREAEAWESLRRAQRAIGARSRPSDALEARIQVVETLRSARGARFGATAYNGVPEVREQLDGGAAPGDPDAIPGGAEAVAVLANRLAEAATYWIAPDMVDLLEAAAATMPSQPVLASDLPSPLGFAWLPFTAGDAFGYGSLRAMAWDTEGGGSDQVRVTTFLDLEDWVRQTREDATSPAVRTRGFPLFPDRWHDWTLGREWESSFLPDAHLSEGPIKVPPAVFWRRRFCQAMWALIAEPYVDVVGQRAERPVLRRAERARLRAAGDVRVITLRRQHHAAEGDTERPVDWSHRWIVSGHWRRQWYPAQEQHRLRYILPHVKGPDDKPLVVKDTVFALRR
ncbi:MAG: hypothetical protein ACRD03_16690 [Acidimicrobiales bacterium]